MTKERKGNHKDFKSNLRRLRKERIGSQEKLAHRLGKKQSVISAWELGRYEPDIETLKKISRALGCVISELVGNGN